MNCRHCGSPAELPFVDLGIAPPSNAYLTAESLDLTEQRFPLRVVVCKECWLVQTEDYADAAKLFHAEYAYFSGFSISWLAHAERYVAEMTARFGLGPGSHVVEVAANDGYLLQYVVARGIPCTGIEPTAITAAAALAKGIPIVQEFFGVRLARALADQGKTADLMVANNVLAHVPDINDFVAGFVTLLNPAGIATFEFPHLLRLVSGSQFDTIYHEHFSYLSLTAVDRIFTANGLSVFDVEELSTHGGSLRVFARRRDAVHPARNPRVEGMLRREADAGMTAPAFYTTFQSRTDAIRDGFRSFLAEAKRQVLSVAAYGAAAKGNTLLNYAEVGPDQIAFVAERNPAKQGKFMPGSRIPIVDERHLLQAKPALVIILPWNLKAEVREQLRYIGEWGGRTVTAVPRIEVHDSL
jgi:SAM-dependent methyltransferase